MRQLCYSVYVLVYPSIFKIRVTHYQRPWQSLMLSYLKILTILIKVSKD